MSLTGDKTTTTVTGSEQVMVVGGDNGISPAEHRRIVEGLIADKQRELTAQQTLLERAHAAELGAAQSQITLLTDQITELRRKLANPDAAYAEDTARAADIAAQLDREANHLGQEKIASAKEALKRLDYSKADALFEEVKAQNQLALEQIARAEFGQGEIAEARIDWPNAAAHYARAAELHPSCDSFHKAQEFAMRSGQYQAALTLSDKYLPFAKAESETDHAKALNIRAALLNDMGRYDEAEPLFRQAIAIGKATLGEDHPDYATRLNNLAGLLRSMGRYAEAEPLYRQAIAIGKATLGEDHPDYARDLNNLAGLLEGMGRYDEAEPLFRQAIAIGKATLGEDHPDYATGLNNLAGLLESMGRYDEAEPLYRQAIAIDKATLGEDHPGYARDLNNLAVLYYRMQRFEEAAALMAQALAIFEAKLPEGHPSTEVSRQSLAAIRAKLP